MTPEQEAVAERMANEAAEVVVVVSKLLARKGSGVAGAALADLTAMWVAAHFPAEVREPLLQGWLETVRQLIPLNEAENLKRHGLPVPGEPN